MMLTQSGVDFRVEDDEMDEDEDEEIVDMPDEDEGMM